MKLIQFAFGFALMDL